MAAIYFAATDLLSKNPTDIAAEETKKLENELVLVAEEVFVIGTKPPGESTKS